MFGIFESFGNWDCWYENRLLQNSNNEFLVFDSFEKAVEVLYKLKENSVKDKNGDLVIDNDSEYEIKEITLNKNY